MVDRSTRFALWWRRSNNALRVGIVLFIGLLLSLLVYLQRPDDDTGQIGSNLLVFFLVNLIVVVLCILAFLIGRNVVKLIFDRRRNILGSKLRLRLVVAFVGLTLVPTTIVFVLASGLLSNAMEGWFSGQVESVVGGAVEVAKQHHAWLRDHVQKSAEQIVFKVENTHKARHKEFLEQERQDRALFSIELRGLDLRPIVRVVSAADEIESFREPELNRQAFAKAIKQIESTTLFEEREASQFVRAYQRCKIDSEIVVLVLTARIPPELSHATSLVNEAFKEYEQLKLFRSPLKSAYILTLSMITGLILFAAVWFGFYVAKEISVPIQKLAEGTKAVGKGNYDFQIKSVGDDEIGILVESFNRMMLDLKESRKEAESRRVYLEAILTHLAVGVIALDTKGMVTAVNAAASRLLDISNTNELIGKPVSQVLNNNIWREVEELLNPNSQDELQTAEFGDGLEREINYEARGREFKLLCTAGKVISSEGKWQATVLLFDDITELVKAQHMSAWREVARRIAHEIKNPLTPIQLSAQRIDKILTGSVPNPAVSESIQTILENVNSIKRLANEFSTYARMPKAELESADLNQLIADSILPFAETHTQIVFQFIPDSNLPLVSIDREQIRRILINLLDNAIRALNSSVILKRVDSPRVVIKTHYHEKDEQFSFEVSDNGPGVPEQFKKRIFEPYFTTHHGGTGLGLAIVTSIVDDHHGSIVVLDNEASGARFIVQMPVSQKHTTQRRLAVTNL